MARSKRDAKLETREGRSKLPIGKRHWVNVEKGHALGYRRGANVGTWYMRRALPGNKYAIESIGLADDGDKKLSLKPEDVDAIDLDAETLRGAVFDYFGAQRIVRRKIGDKPKVKIGYTVADACKAYIEHIKAKKKSGYTVEKTLNAHVVPVFGEKQVQDLTKDEIEAWHEKLSQSARRMRGKLVEIDNDPETIRQRRNTANRILGVFKAALNQARTNKKMQIDATWNDVKPFYDVEDSRKVFLNEAQCRRLINVCKGAFKSYVQALLYTGARPGKELQYVRVQDFDADAGTLRIPDGKTGGRDVYLTDEGVKFFARLATGRKPDEFLLVKDDGTTWGKNHHARLFKRAVKAAKLPAATNAYALRHSYVSLALKNGMNLQVLAESCGTSIRMLESNYGKYVHADRRKMFNRALPSFGLKRDNVRALR